MPDFADIFAAMRAHKRAVEAKDADALKEQTDAYQGVADAIRQALTRLLDQRAAAEAKGESVGLSWLFQRDRLTAMLDQARQQIDHYAARLGPAIAGYQRQAAGMAGAHSLEAVEAQIADDMQRLRVVSAWNRLPVGAIDHLIGALADGTPLSKRLEQIAPKAVPEIRRAIVQGFAVGKGAKALSKDVSDAANIARDDALRLVRNETLRAYRETARSTYEANSGTVSGWRWTASRSARTCAACLAMDGREFPADQPMMTHPCCRCVMSPVVRRPDGSDEETKPRESAEDWLRRQDAAKQDTILGSHAAGEAFRAGKVALIDFVGVKQSDQWGNSIQARSLKSATMSATGRKGGMATGVGLGSPPGSTPPSPPASPSFFTPPGGGEADKWRDRVTADRLAEVTGYAQARGLTVGEYEQAAAAHLTRLLVDAEPFQRVSTMANLEKILDAGRVKSQFETHDSDGLLDFGVRRDVEEKLFGYPHSLPAEERPIYGYLHSDPTGRKATADYDLSNYGSQIALHYKRDVKNRTTFTGGDTINQTNGMRQATITPSPVQNPAWQAISSKAGDVLNIPTFEELAQKAHDEDFDYIEAQFHQGIGVSDISELIFYNVPPSAAVKKKLKALKISYRVIK